MTKVMAGWGWDAGAFSAGGRAPAPQPGQLVRRKVASLRAVAVVMGSSLSWKA